MTRALSRVLCQQFWAGVTLGAALPDHSATARIQYRRQRLQDFAESTDQWMKHCSIHPTWSGIENTTRKVLPFAGPGEPHSFLLQHLRFPISSLDWPTGHQNIPMEYSSALSAPRSRWEIRPFVRNLQCVRWIFQEPQRAGTPPAHAGNNE